LLKAQQVSEIAAIRENYRKKREEIDKEISTIQASITGAVAKATQECAKSKAALSGKRITIKLELEKNVVAAQRMLNEERKSAADLQYQMSNIDKKLLGFRHIKLAAWLKFHAGIT
jgi:vacuolar-type H+-ATPase subunit D/Vma8